MDNFADKVPFSQGESTTYWSASARGAMMVSRRKAQVEKKMKTYTYGSKASTSKLK